MNMLVKRRQLIMATLVVALGAAVFVNWYFTKSGKVASSGGSTDASYVQNIGEAKYVNATNAATETFSNAKLNRNKAHDKALDDLKNVLESLPANSDAGKSVAQSVDALSANIKLESDLETLISAKLGSECVVVISGEKAEVVVKAGALNQETALKITDIVTNNSKLKAENIKIIEAE